MDPHTANNPNSPNEYQWTSRTGSPIINSLNRSASASSGGSSSRAHHGPYSRPSILNRNRPNSTIQRYCPYSRPPIQVPVRHVPAPELDRIDSNLTSTVQMMLNNINKNSSPIVDYGTKKIPIHQFGKLPYKKILPNLSSGQPNQTGPPISRIPLIMNPSSSVLPVPPRFLSRVQSPPKALLPPSTVSNEPSAVPDGPRNIQEAVDVQETKRSNEIALKEEPCSKKFRYSFKFDDLEVAGEFVPPSDFIFSKGLKLLGGKKAVSNGPNGEDDRKATWDALFSIAEKILQKKSETKTSNLALKDSKAQENADLSSATLTSVSTAIVKTESEPARNTFSFGDKRKSSSGCEIIENGPSSFQKPTNPTWKCDTCLVGNSMSATKCVCCETPRPVKKDSENPGKVQSHTVTKNEVKASQNWRCRVCLVDNPISAAKCLCCGDPSPVNKDTGPVSSPQNQSVAKVEQKKEEPQFKFGFGDAASVPEKKENKLSPGSFRNGFSIPVEKPKWKDPTMRQPGEPIQYVFKPYKGVPKEENTPITTSSRNDSEKLTVNVNPTFSIASASSSTTTITIPSVNTLASSSSVTFSSPLPTSTVSVNAKIEDSTKTTAAGTGFFTNPSPVSTSSSPQTQSGTGTFTFGFSKPTTPTSSPFTNSTPISTVTTTSQSAPPITTSEGLNKKRNEQTGSGGFTFSFGTTEPSASKMKENVTATPEVKQSPPSLFGGFGNSVLPPPTIPSSIAGDKSDKNTTGSVSIPASPSPALFTSLTPTTATTSSAGTKNLLFNSTNTNQGGSGFLFSVPTSINSTSKPASTQSQTGTGGFSFGVSNVSATSGRSLFSSTPAITAPNTTITQGPTFGGLNSTTEGLKRKANDGSGTGGFSFGSAPGPALKMRGDGTAASEVKPNPPSIFGGFGSSNLPTSSSTVDRPDGNTRTSSFPTPSASSFPAFNSSSPFTPSLPANSTGQMNFNFGSTANTNQGGFQFNSPSPVSSTPAQAGPRGVFVFGGAPAPPPQFSTPPQPVNPSPTTNFNFGQNPMGAGGAPVLFSAGSPAAHDPSRKPPKRAIRRLHPR